MLVQTIGGAVLGEFIVAGNKDEKDTVLQGVNMDEQANKYTSNIHAWKYIEQKWKPFLATTTTDSKVIMNEIKQCFPWQTKN